jgi:hypothetical protein
MQNVINGLDDYLNGIYQQGNIDLTYAQVYERKALSKEEAESVAYAMAEKILRTDFPPDQRSSEEYLKLRQDTAKENIPILMEDISNAWKKKITLQSITWGGERRAVVTDRILSMNGQQVFQRKEYEGTLEVSKNFGIFVNAESKESVSKTAIAKNGDRIVPVFIKWKRFFDSVNQNEILFEPEADGKVALSYTNPKKDENEIHRMELSKVGEVFLPAMYEKISGDHVISYQFDDYIARNSVLIPSYIVISCHQTGDAQSKPTFEPFTVRYLLEESMDGISMR